MIVVSKIRGLRTTSDDSLIELLLVPADATKRTSPLGASLEPNETIQNHRDSTGISRDQCGSTWTTLASPAEQRRSRAPVVSSVSPVASVDDVSQIVQQLLRCFALRAPVMGTPKCVIECRHEPYGFGLIEPDPVLWVGVGHRSPVRRPEAL